MAKIDQFFRALKDKGGSDLHLQAGQPPKFRIHGRLEPLSGHLRKHKKLKVAYFAQHQIEDLEPNASALAGGETKKKK